MNTPRGRAGLPLDPDKVTREEMRDAWGEHDDAGSLMSSLGPASMMAPPKEDPEPTAAPTTVDVPDPERWVESLPPEDPPAAP